jgi:polysaccharide biosynthesis protein PslG
MRRFSPIRMRAVLRLALVLVVLGGCAPQASAPSQRPTTSPPAPSPAASPAEAAAASPAQAFCLAGGTFPPLIAGPHYGINVFLFGTDQERVLALVRNAGFTWARQQIHWRDIETQPGSYDWRTLDAAVAAAEAAQIKLMLSVVRSPAWLTANGQGGLPDDPQAIAPFLSALAARYRDRVAAYEIWNEPNLALENGGRVPEPAHYLAVLRAANPAIKAADPCALTLAAPLAATATNDPALARDDLSFYQELYALEGGAFLTAADAIALHPGGGPHAPEASWPAGEPERSRQHFRHLEQVRALMERYGDRRQAWITEVGWTVYEAPGAPQPVSEASQADYLVGALRLTQERYPWIVGVLVWNLNFGVLGPTDDEKSTFGILRPDWTPRPAYLALQRHVSAEAQAQAQSAPELRGTATYKPAWAVRTLGGIRGALAVVPGGSIYYGTRYGTIHAVAQGGGERWSVETSGPVRNPPASAPDGTLYVGDNHGHVLALTPEGRQRWRVVLGRGIGLRGAPQLAPDALYLAHSGGEALRLSLDGEIEWRAPLGAAGAPPLLVDDLLYVPTEAGTVLALEVQTGAPRWRSSPGRPIVARPLIADGLLIVADSAGYLSALDPADGTLRWERQVVQPAAGQDPRTSLTIGGPLLSPDGQTIYLAARDGSLHALDRQGRERWQTRVDGQIVGSPTLGPDGQLFVATNDSRLIALDSEGRQRWEAQLDGEARGGPLFTPDGDMVVGTAAGMLYYLVPRA